MDLGNPIRSVIPSAQGLVLAVLARTEQSLSGRRVAELTGGELSVKGTYNALQSLVKSGLVLVEDQPPSKLYRLNRRHLAAESILALTQLRGKLLDALRGHLASWEPAALAAWLFGSAARGEGSAASDIDILVVRPDNVADDVPAWLDQLDDLSKAVRAWTGNPCSILEYSEREFSALMTGPEPLADELRSNGIRLAGDLELRDLRRRAAP